MTCQFRIGIVQEPISEKALREFCSHPSTGAVVCFSGTVRDHSDGRRVRSLAYDAYESMAVKCLRELAVEASERWPLRHIAIEHRIGEIPIGETAVTIAVGADHRREAFEGCWFLIDAVKESVPIWKRETTDQGSAWVTGEPDSSSPPQR